MRVTLFTTKLKPVYRKPNVILSPQLRITAGKDSFQSTMVIGKAPGHLIPMMEMYSKINVYMPAITPTLQSKDQPVISLLKSYI
jgi:hypothetical protein